MQVMPKNPASDERPGSNEVKPAAGESVKAQMSNTATEAGHEQQKLEISTEEMMSQNSYRKTFQADKSLYQGVEVSMNADTALTCNEQSIHGLGNYAANRQTKLTFKLNETLTSSSVPQP